MDDFPNLQTDEFILRQFGPDDLESIYEGLSNPDVVKYYGVSYKTLEACKEQLAWFNALEVNKSGIWWAICDKEHHEFLGAIGFNNLNKLDIKIEIGFWLLPNNWGKGIITAVGNMVCNYAFETLHVNKIEAFVESENKNCIKLLSKLSFNFENLMKECETKNDKLISVVIYARNKALSIS